MHRWLRAASKAAGAIAILGGGGVAVHAILSRREIPAAWIEHVSGPWRPLADERNDSVAADRRA